MAVVRDDLARIENRVKENSFRRAPLMSRNDVLETGQLADHGLEAVERPAARVRLVALHQRAPLRRRHRAGPRIGQEIDQDVFGRQLEDVELRLLEGRGALLPGRELERLDRLDSKRLDDGVEWMHYRSGCPTIRYRKQSLV